MFLLKKINSWETARTLSMLSERVCTNYAFLPKMMQIMLATLYTANALCHNECKSSIQKREKRV